MDPLQIGVPGAAELFVLVIILLLVFGVVGRLIYRDARRRGSDWAWQWGVGVSLLFLAGIVPGLLAVIIYVLVRPDEVAVAP